MKCIFMLVVLTAAMAATAMAADEPTYGQRLDRLEVTVDRRLDRLENKVEANENAIGRLEVAIGHLENEVRDGRRETAEKLNKILDNLEGLAKAKKEGGEALAKRRMEGVPVDAIGRTDRGDGGGTGVPPICSGST